MPFSRSVRFYQICALATLIVFPAAGLAADSTYRTEYNISIFAMTIARSEMDTRITDSGYSLSGSFYSSGLARIFDQTNGEIKINGKSFMRSNLATLQPAAFLTTYRSGKKHKRTAIQFTNGAVTNYHNQPAINKVAPWVELQAKHLKSVFDPITAMMISSPSAAAVCSRSLEIFDGQTRAQLRLSPAGTQAFSTTGFSGTAITCDAKFVPVAGYEQDKKSLRYLADKSKITISFASLNTDANGAGIYAPVSASVGTKIGTVKVRATRFEQISK